MILQLIESLRKELHQHNHAYYVLSQPIISDYEFDQKLKRLQELESQFPEYFDKNSPTMRVGSDISNNFKKVKHVYPMLSLGNTYNINELTYFFESASKNITNSIEYVCELKYDGTSISLTYENGELVQALTRGDGEKGDDVTENIKTIKSIPLKLVGNNIPQKFEIRGEIVMPFSSFEFLNAERIKKGEEPFSNPRNAVSGSVKQKNSAEVAKRKLDAYFYHPIGEGFVGKTHYENLKTVESWGIKISKETVVCKSISDVNWFIHHWDKERKNLPFLIDGIVIKINYIHQQKQLGFTSKTPRWATSYKFKAESESTKLLDITYQVGRTGTITPVAELEPINVGGVVVRRATLHNEDFMLALDLCYDDHVYVFRAGEVIPAIGGVDENFRTCDSRSVEFITHCPECGTKIIRYDGESAHYCPNNGSCPPQIKGKFEHFVSRKAMNINIGPETIDLLFQQGLINELDDLYSLNYDDLRDLDRFGDKKAKNLLESIEKSKEMPFQKVLYGIGIKYVGETVSKKLVNRFKTLENIANATYDELISVDDIGESIANSIIEWFKVEKNYDLFGNLQIHGLNFGYNNEITNTLPTNTFINGKTFVITGGFEEYSRDQLKDIIETKGGKVSGSVSSKTNYLLAGENCGSKLSKATELGVNILGINEFFELIK